MVWTVVPPKFQGDISLIRSSDGSLLAFEKSADVVRFEGTADETYTFVPSPVP